VSFQYGEFTSQTSALLFTTVALFRKTAVYRWIWKSIQLLRKITTPHSLSPQCIFTRISKRKTWPDVRVLFQ